jgi:hypothetical protein
VREARLFQLQWSQHLCDLLFIQFLAQNLNRRRGEIPNPKLQTPNKSQVLNIQEL